MYEVKPTAQFRRDLKRILRRGYKISLLTDVIKILAAGKKLPQKYQDHDLIGNYTGYRECHITPDWLLIYKIQNDQLFLVVSRSGTHSGLF